MPFTQVEPVVPFTQVEPVVPLTQVEPVVPLTQVRSAAAERDGWFGRAAYRPPGYRPMAFLKRFASANMSTFVKT